MSSRPLQSLRRRLRRLGSSSRLATVAAAAVFILQVGCGHAPVKPWQREHLARRAMNLDDGLEGRFRQHMFSSREGADGGYGQVGGGCGCN